MRPLSLMGPLSRQEQRFLQILASFDRAAAVGDRLTLYLQ
jgi:hypothetical protein